MNEEYIKVDKEGYIKIPDFLLKKSNDFFYVIGNIEIRMYPKKYLKPLTEFLELTYSNEEPNIARTNKRVLYGKRIIDSIINKNRIKLPYMFLQDNLDKIFIAKKDNHIKLFKDEEKYNEYLDSIKKFTK